MENLDLFREQIINQLVPSSIDTKQKPSQAKIEENTKKDESPLEIEEVKNRLMERLKKEHSDNRFLKILLDM